jgi:hypothetical protein
LPIQLSSGDRKLFLIAGVVFLAMVGTTLVLTRGGESPPDDPSTYATGSRGAKAAYLLLKASGYTVERWEQSLSELPPSEPPEADGRILILASPVGSPTTEERNRLREFVRNGGHVIAAGTFAGIFLPENGSEPDPVSGMVWKKLSALSPSSITRAAPEITLAPRAYWKTDSLAVPLYGDADKPNVVKYAFGKGEVIWWAAATPLTNAGLKEPGNLEFFLACIGEDHEKQILWDEYFHGYRRSLTATAAKTPVKWIFLQFGLFALAILLTYSRRSGPISVPVREVRLSPLEFVRMLGSLYKQANAASVAVDICYHRFRYWLTRRLGMASNAPVDELERAIRDRWSFEDAKLNATLRACESAPFDYTLKPRVALQLVRSLYDYAAKLKLFPKSGKEKS